MHEIRFCWYQGKDGYESGEVKYVFIGTACYYIGVTFGANVRRPIDATHEIILAICKDNGLVPRDMTFYEVMTRAAYGYILPGTYSVERILAQHCSEGLHTERERVSCLEPVDRIFAAFIPQPHVRDDKLSPTA